MQDQNNKLKIYLFSDFTLSGIMAVLYVLCFLLSFDRSIGYFDASPLTTVLHSLLALTVLWVASMLLLIPRNGLTVQAHPLSRSSHVLLYILTAAFIISTYLQIQLITTSSLSIFISILGGISAAYTCCTAMEHGPRPEQRSLLGYGVIVWCFLTIVDAYFNRYVAMNGPLKVLLMFSMVFLMLFQLYDVGFTVGRGRPRLYAAFGLLNVLLSLSFALSYFVCLIGGIQRIPEFLPAAIVTPVYAVYSVSRLFDLSKAATCSDTAEQSAPPANEAAE